MVYRSSKDSPVNISPKGAGGIIPSAVFVIFLVFLLTSCGISGNIELQDPDLLEAVRQEMGLANDERVTVENAEKVNRLDLRGKGIKSLKGLESFTSLEVLDVRDNEIMDISPVAEIANLKAVYLTGNNIDISLSSPAYKIVRSLKSKGAAVKWLPCFTRTLGLQKNADEAVGIFHSADGGYLITGNSSHSADGFSSRNQAWLVCADAFGNDLWKRDLIEGSRAEKARGTSDGGFIICGQAVSSPGSPFGPWLAKVSASGDEEWGIFLGKEFPYTNILDIRETGDKGYILVGEKVTGSGNDLWLAKTDSLGVVKWSRVFGTAENQWGNGVVQTLDGGYLVTGHSFSFSPHGNAWLIKTDSTGVEEWSKTVGEPSSEIHSIYPAAGGGYIAAGEAGGDGWLLKINESGEEEWSKTIGGEGKDKFLSVTGTSDGGFVVAGQTNWAFTTGGDAWLLKVNQLGQEQWSRVFPGDYNDSFLYAGQTADGGYMAVGIVNQYIGAQGGDGWLIRTDEKGETEEDPSWPDF